MRQTVSFKQIPVRVELRAPMPNGAGETLQYSNIALVIGDAELETPLSLEVETESGDPLEALKEALHQAAIAGREVATEQFFRFVDQVEQEMAERRPIRL